MNAIIIFACFLVYHISIAHHKRAYTDMESGSTLLFGPQEYKLRYPTWTHAVAALAFNLSDRGVAGYKYYQNAVP